MVALARQRQGINRRKQGFVASVAAPLGGWDANSPVMDMPEDRAISLVNLFPREGGLDLRGGYASHATGMADAAVESLLVWNGPVSSKMFAANDGDVFDVTSSGAVGAAAISSLTNDRWQFTNITTSGGHFLVICNGADAVRNFDGTNWTTPTINNVTSSTLINVTSYKRRLWFVEKDSTSAWYLPVESIGGDATEFVLGPTFTKGGHLVAAEGWTRDGGAGPDDYLAFVSSEGEVAVYAGTDPASADTWAIVGVYQMGPPIGLRCLHKFGGDLVALTTDGVVSVPAAALLDRTQSEKASVTTRIRDAFSRSAKLYKTLFGWQLVFYPGGKMAFVNVPLQEGIEQEQYVMNTITGAWCRFTDLDANCWAVFNEKLYFGGNGGVVYLADSGTDDNGANINFRCRWAYNHLGRRGRVKEAHMIRPAINTNGSITPAIGVDFDFKTEEPYALTEFTNAGVSLWDTAVWDVATWGGSDTAQIDWSGVGGVGYQASVHVKGSAQGLSCRIIGFDMLCTEGGLWT